MHKIVGGGIRQGAKGFKGLLDTAHKRSSRVILVAVVCLLLAALAALIGIVWGLWNSMQLFPTGTWQIAFWLAAGFVALAFVAPFLRIWILSVPDNEVWMILDSTDHLKQFVGSGVYRIRPVDGAKKYEEKGPIPIAVNLEQVITSDHFPYHVTVSATAVLNPLNARPENWKTLRSMKAKNIGDAIQADISDLVKREMAQRGRGEIEPQALVETLRDVVASAVETRAGLGIALLPGNSIKVELVPPSEVIKARNELWAEEANAKARFKHLAELLEMAGANNMSVTDLGRLHFLLNPKPGARINISNPRDLFSSLPAAPPPPIQMPKLDAPTVPNTPVQIPPVAATPPAPPIASPPAPPVAQPPAPPSVPELPDTRPGKPVPPEPDVIETEQDESGTYIPRNPIIRPRKSRPGGSHSDPEPPKH